MCWTGGLEGIRLPSLMMQWKREREILLKIYFWEKSEPILLLLILWVTTDSKPSIRKSHENHHEGSERWMEDHRLHQHPNWKFKEFLQLAFVTWLALHSLLCNPIKQTERITQKERTPERPKSDFSWHPHLAPHSPLLTVIMIFLYITLMSIWTSDYSFLDWFFYVP